MSIFRRGAAGSGARRCRAGTGRSTSSTGSTAAWRWVRRPSTVASGTRALGQGTRSRLCRSAGIAGWGPGPFRRDRAASMADIPRCGVGGARRYRRQKRNPVAHRRREATHADHQGAGADIAFPATSGRAVCAAAGPGRRGPGTVHVRRQRRRSSGVPALCWACADRCLHGRRNAGEPALGSVPIPRPRMTVPPRGTLVDAAPKRPARDAAPPSPVRRRRAISRSRCGISSRTAHSPWRSRCRSPRCCRRHRSR